MVHAARQRKKSLERICDACFDLLRRHPGIKRCHHHHGNVDRGKQVHRHADYRHHSHNGDHQATDNDEIRIADRKSSHQFAPSSSTAGSTTSFAITFSPFRNWLWFPITTRSPSFNPERTSALRFPCVPMAIFRSCTVSLLSITSTRDSP